MVSAAPPGSTQASARLSCRTAKIKRKKSDCAVGKRAELTKPRVPMGAAKMSSREGKLWRTYQGHHQSRTQAGVLEGGGPLHGRLHRSGTPLHCTSDSPDENTHGSWPCYVLVANRPARHQGVARGCVHRHGLAGQQSSPTQDAAESAAMHPGTGQCNCTHP